MTSSFRRRGALSVSIAVLGVALLAAGAYFYRAKAASRTAAAASPGAVPSRGGGGLLPAATEPLRGSVTVDPRRQQLTGIRVAPVQRTTLSSAVRTTGVVRYDDRRQVDVNVKIDGWIRDLDVNVTGQPVRRGQRLFTLYSPELLATQNEFILALRSRDQADTSPAPDTRDYVARLAEAARQRLLQWDLSREAIQAIETSREPIDALPFTAPAGGVVVETQAVRGMHVTAGQTLYKIADLSIVWVEADVYPQDTAQVRVGGPATVTLDAYPERRFAGRAVYFYPALDPQTRTMKVRFEFANPGGVLKPGMFATVELRGSETRALTVPANAVLDTGMQQTVFIASGEGVFTPRQVKVGRRTGDAIEIVEGVTEGEQVATAATFFLDSESQLRAGLQNYEAAQSAGAAPPSSASPPSSSLDVTFRPVSEAPRPGDNVFEVNVKDASGNAVADADVRVELSMAAMPTMNMPAMRNEIKLPPVGGGQYRGAGQVMTAGRWDVTVTVSKGGQRLGSGRFALVAN